MAHPKKTIDDAFQAYLQCRTIEGAANLCNLPKPTVRKWKIKYRWEDKLEEYKDELAEDPFEKNTALEKYIENFDVANEDAEVMRQVKTVEGVCLACMRAEVPKDQIALQPRSFKEAVECLKVCWQTRETVLHRDKKGGGITVHGPAKFDFVTQDKNESSSK